MLRLQAVEVERLTELITDAWRMRAPRTLVDDAAAVGSDAVLSTGEDAGD
jgi:hypothetical protein